MNRSAVDQLVIIGLLSCQVIACSKQVHEAQADLRAAEHGDSQKTTGEPKDETEHQSHDHGKDEVSDLDQPVEKLFASTCEHDIKTYACDECRYEVGVVKAESSLFEGGLLRRIKPEKQPLTVPLGLTGEVHFDDRRVTHVSTQAEGIISKVQITLGDRVKRGQALIELESVAVGEAEAAYLEAQGLFELARRNHDRLNLLRQEGISSEKELLAAKQELDAAKIRTEAALGKLNRLGMRLAETSALTQTRSKGRLVLRSPAGGIVLAMHAVAGEIARSETSLVTIGDNSALWVWADLYERDVALVTENQTKQPLRAVVKVKAFPGEEFKGTVDFVSPSMSETSRTVKVRIAVPNPEGRLLAGMFAQVTIAIPGDEQVLTVPSKAVLEDEGRFFVFIHHDNDYYVRRPVTKGQTFDQLVEITAGLVGEETLIADGAFLLKSDVLRSKMGAGCAD